MRRVGGHCQIVDAADVGVDAFRCRHTDHFVDAARHGLLHRHHALPARRLEILFARPAEAARQPAAIAA
ncbi:hypothetical protein AJ88_48110 [Mesorhizobium amorphae CCBAU 01583]|nr:hypothetical protein AJ88_48110 [Mesorhizobium amorphae CCBAU 01583]